VTSQKVWHSLRSFYAKLSGPPRCRLTPALYETPKVKTRKLSSDVSGLMKSQIGMLFFWVMFSVGGFCSR